MSTNDADRLIGRLPTERRAAILDALVASSRPGRLVAIEHAYTRKLDEAKVLIGELVALAFSSSSGTSHMLIVDPVDPELRVVALSAAHVLRIRAAHPYGSTRPGAHRLGEVLAGPPLPPTTATNPQE